MKSNAVKKPSYDQLLAENQFLKFEIANLRKVIFGQKRERFIPEKNDQLTFLNMPVSSEPLSKTEKITYTRNKRNQKKKHPSRQLLPATRVDALADDHRWQSRADADGAGFAS